MIECIPNVSEGRRLLIVARMAEAIGRVSGIRLLDTSSDPSHNRSVFTIVGNPSGLEQAIIELYAFATTDIDLRTHRGEHPRIGAVDVVPFVPLLDTTMAECVATAKRVGSEVAARFGIPVFLYEEAATKPERRHLEDIRRGQFEGLAAKLATPEWSPDFGPVVPHPTAGASAIGARRPLIAYNVNLASARLDVAKAIAAAIRQRNGGLPFVKALGVSLADRGIVQVTTNLTNFEETSIEQVFDAINAEAARHGVEVLESEFVGLVPAAALRPGAAERLRIADFRESQILENRLREGPAR